MSRMLEEIRQQPEALERTLSAELRAVEKFKRLLEKQRPRLVVGISQSGESTDTNLVLERARRRG